MFANQPKESFKFEDEVLLPASSLQKKSLPDQQDLVQSASTRDKSSSKDIFYCVNTSYPMDNSLSGRRGPARQTSEKDVLCLHRLGRPSGVHSPDGV